MVYVNHLRFINLYFINNLLYADDVVILPETSSGLQICLDKLQKYCRKWKLAMNAKKTKTIIVAKRQLAMENSFIFNGNVIETCKSYPFSWIFNLQ